MSLPAWREAAISKAHDRETFDCGDASRNEFFRRHARQSHERGRAKTFVAVPVGEEARVLGFYGLSPASIDHARTPALVSKGLARYEVPVFRLDVWPCCRACGGGAAEGNSCCLLDGVAFKPPRRLAVLLF